MVNLILVEAWSLLHGVENFGNGMEEFLKNENAKQLAAEMDVEAVVKMIHKLYIKRNIHRL